MADVEQQLILQELMGSSSEDEGSSEDINENMDDDDDFWELYNQLQLNRCLEPRTSPARVCFDKPPASPLHLE